MKQTLRMWIWTMVGVLIVIGTYVVFDSTHSFYKLYCVGNRLFDEGKYAQALPYLLGAYRISPEDKTIGWKLIWSFQKLGREGEARRVLEEISAKIPEDPASSESLGDMAYSTKAYALAHKYYERVLMRKPSDNIRKKYANVLFAEKIYTDAINQMDILISRSPGDQDLRYQHAQIISALGDHERAVRELQALLDDGYKNKEAVIMLADELRLLGRDEEAIKIYQEVSNEK